VESCPLSGPFFHIPQTPCKISLNKEIFPFFKGARKEESLPVSQKRGPYWTRRPFQEHYLAYLALFCWYCSINRTVLEDATNTKSHGNQRLHVQWWKAPDDGHNSVRNM
jgi:hypothetical protein